MRKMTFVSALTLVLCFALGYAAYQTAYLIKSLIVGPQQSECRNSDGTDCNPNARRK